MQRLQLDLMEMYVWPNKKKTERMLFHLENRKKIDIAIFLSMRERKKNDTLFILI